MAEVDVVREEGFGQTHRHTWETLTNGDTGEPVSIPGAADRSVQVTGTFGAGGTVVIQGSLEKTATNWATLTDPQGNALSFTAAGLEMVAENVTWIRPSVTGGDGTTDLDVTLLSRSTS